MSHTPTDSGISALVADLREDRRRMNHKHPMQPIVMVNGVARFQKNALVEYLLDNGGISLNDLAMLPNISRADREQFAQLIGYSVSGFGELGYSRKKTVAKADARVDALLKALKGGA